ncbi:MAG: tetratricopeptide repeat protein [Bacteroidia bacterium]|nr:tetratricopeptide repeat protein [Bacteroidia bacterium]
MAHPDLLSELALIERALQPEQFRLLVVQYNHHQVLVRLQDRLQTVFPTRAWTQLDGSRDGAHGILVALQQPPSGLILIHHTEALLDDDAFTRSLNQRRDALSRHPLGLILLLPTGGNYLYRLSRAMPDIWSLRNLVAELHLPPDPILGGQFITLDGIRYVSFSTQEEAAAELNSLSARISELQVIPGSRPLLAVLLTRKGKIQLQLGEYEAAQATFLQSLELAQDVGDRVLEATALTELGEVLARRGDYETALQYLENSLNITREIGDKSGEGTTLNNISQIYAARGDYETALQYLEQSLRIRREIGDKSGEGTTLNNISQIYDARGDYETALVYLEHSLRIRREIGDKSGEGTTLNNLSHIYAARGDYETALVYLEHSLRIRREIGDKSGEGTTLNNISQIYAARGDYGTALQYLEKSLRIQREIGDINGLAITLNNMATIVFQQQDKPEEALPLFLQSYQLFKQIGSPNEKVPMSYLQAIREQLGPARYQEILQSLPSA